MSQLFARFSVEIAASPAVVWSVLVDPELTRQYMFGCEAVSEWKVGSRLDWRGHFEGKEHVFVTGTVVAFEPEKFLSYTTFDPQSGLEAIAENFLTMSARLTASGRGTLLELAQGDFNQVQNSRQRYEDTIAGSSELLDKLKALAEADGR